MNRLDPKQRTELKAELNKWHEAGRLPKVWWRDDDAVEASASLDLLCEIASECEVPLCLAVIPDKAQESLADFVRGNPAITIATHGYSHANHAPDGAKKIELCENPPLRGSDDVVNELLASRRIMERLFGSDAASRLVPPWNRVSGAVAMRLPKAGFHTLSGFGEKPFCEALPQVDCHLDLMNWRPLKKGKQPVEVVDGFITELQKARKSGRDHIGILSHHLVHDDNAWAATSLMMRTIKEFGGQLEAVNITALART